MKRGDVVRVDLPRPSGKPGREQFGIRPAIIVQDDAMSSLPTVLVVPCTSQVLRLRLNGTVRLLPTPSNGLSVESVALTHQVRAIDRNRIVSVDGTLSADDLAAVDHELRRLLKLH